MSTTKAVSPGSLDRVVSLRSIHDVMRHGLKHGWTAEQVLTECKARFGRLRIGPGHIREHYNEMKQANDKAQRPEAHRG